MKSKFGVLIRLIVIMGFLFSLIGFGGKPVHAEITKCSWNGDISTDWYTAGNWDCGQIPMSEDYDVVIPSDGATRYPVLPSPSTSGVHVNSILIKKDGQLIIDADFMIVINANSFINNGTIDIIEKIGNKLKIFGTFNNNGTVKIGSTQSWLILTGAGTHTGSFIGNHLNFNQTADRTLNTFTSFSNIDVRDIYVLGNHDIDIDGSIDCSKDFIIRNDSTVTISTSGIVDLGDVSVEDTSQLIFRMTGGSYNPGDALSISAGETLSGSGTIQTNLTNAGTVSPGSSPGTITVDGDYTQDPSGTLLIELSGTTPGTYDQLVVTDTAVLDGALQIQLLDSFTPALNDTFTIMTYGSSTGRFEELRLPDLSPGMGWQIEYGLEELTLHVVDASASISGTVIYIGDKGLNPITVDLFEDLSHPPFKSLEVNSTTGSYPYTFENLISGTYYICALMDLNGNHQPDLDEPYTIYSVDGEPFAFELTPGQQILGIDFSLDDPNLIFLPLILR